MGEATAGSRDAGGFPRHRVNLGHGSGPQLSIFRSRVVPAPELRGADSWVGMAEAFWGSGCGRVSF
jgi:hypothetical protein